jgi:RNA polymerase sigma-32 factor
MKPSAKKKKPAVAKAKSQPDRRAPDRKKAAAKPAKPAKPAKAIPLKKTAKPQPKRAPKASTRKAAAVKKTLPKKGSAPTPAPRAGAGAARPTRPAAARPRPKAPAAKTPNVSKAVPAAPAARKPAPSKPIPAKPAAKKSVPSKPAPAAPAVKKPAPPKPAPAAPASKKPVSSRPAVVTPEAQEPLRPVPAAPVAEEPAAPAAKVKPAARRAAKKEPKPKAPKAPRPSKAKKDDDEKSLVKFDPLQRYLSEISKYRLLTRDEERDYGTRVKEQGDKEAAYALVTANLRLVVKIALEFQRVWMQNLLDLIQEGNIGLMQAVKKFDPYKNVKFSYYASFWIKAYILKFIMDNWRLVKIGTTQGQRKLFFKLKKEKQRLIDQGFDPKPKLLSERLGVSEREIVDMDQRLDGWDVSLDAPLKNDSETERIEFLSTDAESIEDQVSKKEIELLLHNKISEFRKKMSPREVEIFELRIFSDTPVTLQEIGDRYEISRERVRQIEKNIIRKMRDFFKREIPDFASYSEDTGME